MAGVGTCIVFFLNNLIGSCKLNLTWKGVGNGAEFDLIDGFHLLYFEYLKVQLLVHSRRIVS